MDPNLHPSLLSTLGQQKVELATCGRFTGATKGSWLSAQPEASAWKHPLGV